jgi:hypothetical protein
METDIADCSIMTQLMDMESITSQMETTIKDSLNRDCSMVAENIIISVGRIIRESGIMERRKVKAAYMLLGRNMMENGPMA